MAASSLSHVFSEYTKNEKYLLELSCYLSISIAVVIFVILLFMPAPYGRYASSKWGFGISQKWAWFIMEAPCLIISVGALYQSIERVDPANACLLGMFICHYIHRCAIFPWLMKTNKTMPFVPFFAALTFATYNSFLQSTYLINYVNYSKNWLYSPRFIAGAIVFLFGAAVNIHSDHVLRTLRRPGDVGYRIPTGGFFEYISGANFLGEILEWWGFAVASSNLPGLMFAIFTSLNLGPRAYHHHRYYRRKFDDYPNSRKALIPFIF